MKRKNATRNALFTSIISLLLCVSMLVGTTFAWFTDEVVSGNNVIAAGNLNVELYNSIDIDESKKVSNTTPLFEEVTLWEPGVVAYENLTVANVGTLALQYQLTMNITGENTVKDTNYKLSDVLKIAVVEGGIKGATREAVLQEVADSGASWETLKTKALSGQLTADTADTVGLVIYWQPTANDNNWNLNNGKTTSNGAETLQITLGINLFATQLQHEKDSFDETYDKNAALEIPEIKVETPTADAFLAALANGETAVLTSDLTLTADGEVPAGVTSAIDLNGHTLTMGEAGCIAVEGNLILTGNGTVVVTDESDDAYVGFQVSEGATMEIQEGVTIDVKSGTIGIALDGELNLVGGTINAEGHGIFMMQADGAEVNLESGKVTGNGDGIYMCLSEADVYAAEGVMDAKITVLSSSTLNLTYAGDTQPTVEIDTTANTVNIRKATGYEGITQNPDNAKQYYIESKAGLKNLNALLDDVAPSEANITTVDLMTDVDLAGESWSPIDSMWVTFNGNNHTIKNINAGFAADGRRSGFWGYAGAVTINELTLENVTVSGSQAGIFAGSAEGLKVNNCYLKGDNTVNFVAGVETWNGIGAITGVISSSTINATITEGTTVTLNKTGFTTDAGCTYYDNLTGYLSKNAGTVTNKGTVKVNASTSDAKVLGDTLASGGDVVLTDDVKMESATTAPYSNKYGVALNGGTLDGNGNELYMECYGDDYGIMTTGGTIKNLTITEGCRAVMIMYPTQDIILDNVNIGGDGVLYTINTGETGPNGPAGIDLIVTNSTLAGWTSYGDAIASASFTNVKFEQGTYYDDIYGRVLKPYVNTTLTGCSFIEHMNLDLSSLVKGQKVTIVNCTVNGQAVTADVFTIPSTDEEYDTELFTVDLPSWATSISECIVFK